jgi:hypothetical protein
MLVVLIWFWKQISSLISRQWSLKVEGKQNVVLLAALLLAGLLVVDPFASVMEFQGHSTRGAPSVLDKTEETKTGTNWEYATRWSLHPKETVSFVYPYFYGLQNRAYWGYMQFTQSTYYLGLVVILMAILGLTLKKPDRESWLWIIATVLILLVGFGKHIPLLYRPLFELAPMFSKFRVPSMIYILLPLTIGVLGARGLQMILSILREGNQKELKKLRSRALIVFGSIATISLFLLIFSGSVSFLKMGQQTPSQQVLDIREKLFNGGALIALLISISCMAAIWTGIKKIISPLVVGTLLIGLTLVDLWIINHEFLNLSKTTQVEGEFEKARRSRVITRLLQDKEHYRILSVDNVHSNFYGYFGISSVSGYRPVKIRNYQDLIDTGGLNQSHIRNMLNVKYFVGRQGMQEITTVLPKAWFISEVISVNDQKTSLEKTLEPFDPVLKAVIVNYDGPQINPESTGNVTVENYEEHEIKLKTTSKTGGLLVLSEIYYAPRWIATVDGEETPIYQTNHVLRSVYVSPGEHEVIFRFDDSLFKTTRLISRVSLTLLLLSIVFIHREKIRGLKEFLPTGKKGK